MKKILATVVLLFLAGCASQSYTAIEDVPDRQRPCYDAMSAFIECAQARYMGIIESHGAETLDAAADKACDACSEELEKFKWFIGGQKHDEDFSGQMGRKLVVHTKRLLRDASEKAIDELKRQ